MKTWQEEFPDGKVDIMRYLRNPSWDPFFKQLNIQILIAKINEKLSEDVKSNTIIFPYPKLLFNTFNLLSFEDVSLIILGQDPYFNFSKTDKVVTPVPEAVGMCFGGPHDADTPPSLKNIYKNLEKYDHFKFKPKHGDLTFWNYQGCLLLNTGLTVEYGHANSHAVYWEKLTSEFIKWISKEKTNLVFILWGNPALRKKLLIANQKNHKIIVSSHPSGLSCHKKLGEYEAFNNQDHFGIANTYLEQVGKNQIIWQVL